MQLNSKKCKVVRTEGISSVDAKMQLDTHLEKTEFEEVEEFVYLKVTILCECNEEKEIEARLSRANMCVGRINHSTHRGETDV